MKSKILALIFGLLIIAATSLAQQPSFQIIPPNNAGQFNQAAADMAAVSSLIRIGDIPRALSILDRLRTTYGDNDNIKALYKQAYKEGKLYDDLENFIRKDLNKDPRNPVLLTELGEARFLKNDETGADSLWNVAIAFGRTDENVYRLVADDMMRYGLYDAAGETYLKGRQNLGKPAAFSAELANLYETQRDYPRAVSEYLIEVLDSPPQLAFVSTMIRGYMEDTDDPQSIIDVVASKIKEVPGRYELQDILGDLYIKENQMDKALECYKTISTRQNDDGQALLKFASRAYDSKAFITASAAVDEYFRITKKGTMKDLARLIKARSQLASGQIELALTGFKSLSGEAADARIRDEAGLSCGIIYAQYKNDCDSALYIWNKMQAGARDLGLKGRAQLEMAICYLKKDDLSKAEDLIKQILAVKLADSTMEKASFYLAEIAFYKSSFQEASDFFKRHIANFPQGDHTNDALVRYEAITLSGEDEANQKYLTSFALAMKALDLGKPLEAAQLLSDSAFAASPISEQAIFYAGTAFAAGNNKTGAMGAFKSYIEKYPDGLYIDRAYLGLGDLYMQDPATYGEAKAAYDKILEAFPDGPVTEVARQRLQKITVPGKIG